MARLGKQREVSPPEDPDLVAEIARLEQICQECIESLVQWAVHSFKATDAERKKELLHFKYLKEKIEALRKRIKGAKAAQASIAATDELVALLAQMDREDFVDLILEVFEKYFLHEGEEQDHGPALADDSDVEEGSSTRGRSSSQHDEPAFADDSDVEEGPSTRVRNQHRR